jgi:hypothetical protein
MLLRCVTHVREVTNKYRTNVQDDRRQPYSSNCPAAVMRKYEKLHPLEILIVDTCRARYLGIFFSLRLGDRLGCEILLT